ncbi:MAG: sulfatase-like hydrolase/transferase [Phycisphaeraceae bacterium]|nr:MAG: sulfatase-like hydrolase/transferase [Phycisphaeraceae bacterium]
MTRPGGRSACGLRIAALVAACGVWGLTPQADAGVRVPPNIVIFYADDMGLGDSSAYQDLTANADEHQLCTPNMERLAALGIRCTDAHTAAAVCSPSRISILSGVYSFRSPLKQSVGYEGQDVTGTYFPGDRRTIPWMLKRVGYRTFGYGKWHLGVQGDKFGTGLMTEGPLQEGFDTYTGTPGNFGGGGAMIQDERYMSFDENWDLVPINSPDAMTWNPTDDPEFCEKIQQINLDTMRANLADHVANHGEKPFFVYYASHGNHTPWITDAQIEGVPLTTDVTIAGGPIPVILGPDDDGDGIPEPNDPLYDPEEDTHWDPYFEYPSPGNPTGTNGPTERAKMVLENDVIIGEMLDFLEQTDDPRVPGAKLIDNTLFIFTSDNGADLRALPPVGALPQASDGVITPIRGKKATPWEGGTRVPFVAVWPGRIPAGVDSDALIGQVDLYATIAQITGHEPEPTEAVDSESIRDALTSGATGVVRATDLIYKRKDSLLIRRGSLKLRADEADFADTGDRFGDNLDFLDLAPDRLYDLFDDLGENLDLQNNGAYALVRQDMFATLQAAVAQGYTRPGAAPAVNGVNFKGGDFHTASNWDCYTADLDGKIPGVQTNATAFIFDDGSADAVVAGTRVIQRGGVFEFTNASSQHTAITNGTVWRLEGGVLRAPNAAFRVDDGSSLVVDGGEVDLQTTPKFLRLTKGDGSIELRRGVVNASVLAFGVLSTATPGSKVFTFGPGDGVVVLSGNDPIRFGDDGDPINDWIDFVPGTRGLLITKLTEADLEALWQADRLRVGGQNAAAQGGSFADNFRVDDNGDGTTTLSLPGGSCPLDLSGDDALDFFDVAALLRLVDADDPAADIDGSGIVDSHDILVYMGAMMLGCPQ